MQFRREPDARAGPILRDSNWVGFWSFWIIPAFLLGKAPLDPFLVEDLAGLPDRAWRALDASFYAQDNFKVNFASDLKFRISL